MHVLYATVALVLALHLLSVAVALEHFPASEDLDASIDRFQRWFSEGYGPDLGVKLAPAGEGMRMGVFATKEWAAETPYLSIPMSMIIGDETIFPTPIVGSALKELSGKFPSHQRAQLTLGLFLLHERFVKGGSSFWKPYIDLLPVSHDSPAFYTDAELLLVNGTGMMQRARDVRRDMLQTYSWIRTSVLRDNKYPEAFPAWAITEAHWLWAAGILNSRMIWWDNGPHLVPMLDMINCRQGPAPYARRVHSTARRGDKAVTLAPWRFKQGDQVFENYGQPNPTYFLYHGFVMHPNVHDCARFVWRDVDSNRKNRRAPSQAYRAKAQELRLWKDDYCVSPANLDEVRAVARVMAADGRGIVELTADKARKQVARRWELRAVRQLALAIHAHLDDFPPVPTELTTFAAAHMTTAQTFDLGAGSRTDGTSDRSQGRAEAVKDSAASTKAFAMGMRDWVKSAEFQAKPFRQRMALEFRESQRALLYGAVQVLREAKASIHAAKVPTTKAATDGPRDEL
jgi:hypothetical protein